MVLTVTERDVDELGKERDRREGRDRRRRGEIDGPKETGGAIGGWTRVLDVGAKAMRLDAPSAGRKGSAKGRAIWVTGPNCR